MAEKRVFKKTTRVMTNARKIFRPWKDWDMGDILIGKYVGSVTDNYGKPSLMIEPEDVQFKDTKFAKEASGKGIILVLNSTTALEKIVEDLKTGSLYQVTYNGVETMEGGKYKGKERHLIDVDEVTEDGGDDDTGDVDKYDEEDFDLDDDEEV